MPRVLAEMLRSPTFGLALALWMTASAVHAQNKPPPALNSQQTNQVMKWIGKQVASSRQPYCYRDSYGRTAGKPLTVCNANEEKNGALCYPKCKSGYGGAGPVCWQSCPSGYKDIGVSCEKPKSYGRGAGYPWKFGDKAFSLDDARKRCNRDHSQGCEKNGEIIYPKCKTGFHNVGCCVCSPNCIDGMRDDGAFCAKKSYGRGAGTPLKCASGLQQDGALCYPGCKGGFHGVGPVCWQNCPSGKVNCGAGCAESGMTCASQTANMVVSPIILAVNIATLGSSSSMTSTYPKIVTQAKDLYAANKAAIDSAKLAYAAGSAAYKYGQTVDLWVGDYVGVFSRMTTPKVDSEIKKNFSARAADWVRRQYAMYHLSLMMESDGMKTAQNVLGAVSGFDPTGVTGVAAAYTNPICYLDEAFPRVSAAY